MKKTYRCVMCSNWTQTKHEIFFGRGNRLVCERYKLQVPLCPKHHRLAHAHEGQKVEDEISKGQEYYKDLFSEKLGIRRNRAEHEVITPKCSRSYLQSKIRDNADRLAEWEV